MGQNESHNEYSGNAYHTHHARHGMHHCGTGRMDRAPIQEAPTVRPPRILPERIVPHERRSVNQVVKDVTQPIYRTVIQPIVQPVCHEYADTKHTLVTHRIQPVIFEKVMPKYETRERQRRGPDRHAPPTVREVYLDPIVKQQRAAGWAKSPCDVRAQPRLAQFGRPDFSPRRTATSPRTVEVEIDEISIGSISAKSYSDDDLDIEDYRYNGNGNGNGNGNTSPLSDIEDHRSNGNGNGNGGGIASALLDEM